MSTNILDCSYYASQGTALEKVNMVSGTQYVVINLVNACILFNPNQERRTEIVCIHTDGHDTHLKFSLRAMFTLLPSIIAQRDLDLQDTPQNIIPIYYICDLMLIIQE